MSTFSTEYLSWVGLQCIVSWETFDSQLGLYLIEGEL